MRPLRTAARSNTCLAALLASGLALLLALTTAPAARANTGDPADYYGGPIVHSATGVVVDWGPNVNPMFTNGTSGDPGLIKSFAAASGSTGDLGGVFAQYANTAYVDNGSKVDGQTFTGSGQTIPAGNAAPSVAFGGQYEITPSVTSSTVSDAQIQNELVSQIQNGNLPQPQGPAGLGTVYLLLFPATEAECLQTGVCGGDYVPAGSSSPQISFCSYHSDARLPNGTIALYEVLPDDTNQQISQECGPSSSALANQTSYASHEWTESITDPLVNESSLDPPGPPLAWYDNNNCNVTGAVCGELADKCNQEQGVVGGFTVQLVWSNLDSACEDTEPGYSQPTASFTFGSSDVVGKAISFSGGGSSDPSEDHTSATWNGTTKTITSGIASYSWNWGDGTPTTTGAIPSHTFAAVGQYQVSLTITDNMGFTSTVTHAVDVSSANPTPPIATTGGATGIDDADATLGGTIDTGGQPVYYEFVYGTSANALNQSTASTLLPPATSLDSVSASLHGLASSTTYYYELVVTAGSQSYPGQVQSFTTSPAPTTTTTTTTTTPPPTTTTTPPPTTPVAPPPATPAAPRLPIAFTGGASGVASAKATIGGSVNPDGTPTSYLVEFGTTKAYGRSSPPRSAGAGTGGVAVSATLTGLRARTVYHYRLVATNAAGTAVGADRTFKTPAPPPPPPRFSFTAPGAMTPAALMAGRLRVTFHCSSACTAHFAVTMTLPGTARLVAVPVTLARGTGRLGRAGSGQATLFFAHSARATLARVRKLVISGYAVRGASAPSAPRTVRLFVTR